MGSRVRFVFFFVNLFVMIVCLLFFTFKSTLLMCSQNKVVRMTLVENQKLRQIELESQPEHIKKDKNQLNQGKIHMVGFKMIYHKS
jgi:hypothetical protein